MEPLALQEAATLVRVAAVMFENIEVINNSNGTSTVIIDLNDEQIKMMENVLGVSSERISEFEKAFEIFVSQAIESYVYEAKK